LSAPMSGRGERRRGPELPARHAPARRGVAMATGRSLESRVVMRPWLAEEFIDASPAPSLPPSSPRPTSRAANETSIAHATPPPSDAMGERSQLGAHTASPPPQPPTCRDQGRLELRRRYRSCLWPCTAGHGCSRSWRSLPTAAAFVLPPKPPEGSKGWTMGREAGGILCSVDGVSRGRGLRDVVHLRKKRSMRGPDRGGGGVAKMTTSTTAKGEEGEPGVPDPSKRKARGERLLELRCCRGSQGNGGAPSLSRTPGDQRSSVAAAPPPSGKRRSNQGGWGCKESDARSLRGGGGELGKLKTLTYGFTTFAQR
jgi:hypothetical protein